MAVKFQQQVVPVLAKDVLDGVLPTLKQFSLGFGFGADIHVMGFVGDQGDAVLSEVFEGDGILPLGCQIGVEFLGWW